MKMKHTVLCMVSALTHTLTYADNGFFQVGYGAEARGVGGAAAAVTLDVFGGASNPATTVWVGDRMEGGLAIIKGKTRMLRTTNATPLLDTQTDSEDATEALGEFAYSKMIDKDLSASVVTYANGASTYLPASTTICPTGPGNAMCGIGKTGVSIKQLILAPTLSKKVSDSVSVGASVLLAGQMFKAEGLQMLAPSSLTPDSVTNQGASTAYGLGLRIGGFWRVNDMLSVGASWSPKIRMSKFKDYKGLLPDQGRFDVPENYLIGASLAVSKNLSFVVDYQRINYGGVAALANKPFDGSNRFGTDDGAGNGWKNMDIYKVGVRYQASPVLRLSVGTSYNTAAFPDESTSANINSPSTFRRHYTLGMGYATSPQSEWSVYYLYAPQHTTTGNSAIAAAFGVSGQDSVGTRQHILGMQYSNRF
jgi:long-chain fatty acid transport protein